MPAVQIGYWFSTCSGWVFRIFTAVSASKDAVSPWPVWSIDNFPPCLCGFQPSKPAHEGSGVHLPESLQAHEWGRSVRFTSCDLSVDLIPGIPRNSIPYSSCLAIPSQVSVPPKVSWGAARDSHFSSPPLLGETPENPPLISWCVSYRCGNFFLHLFSQFPDNFAILSDQLTLDSILIWCMVPSYF